MAVPYGNVQFIKHRDEWDAKLFEAAASGKVVVVFFNTSWCAPGKFIAPFFGDLSEKYPDMVFLEVDMDDHQDCFNYQNVLRVETKEFNVREKYLGNQSAIEPSRGSTREVYCETCEHLCIQGMGYDIHYCKSTNEALKYLT